MLVVADWLLLACVAVLVGLAVGEVWRRRSTPSTADRLLVRRRVIVNLIDGTAVAGVVWEVDGRWLVVRQATLLDRGEGATIDGEVVVEVAKVSFVQALPGAEPATPDPGRRS